MNEAGSLKIISAVRYYDDFDEMYAEQNITFEYQGKRFRAIHVIAYSGAWNKKLIGYEPEDFQRLYGGGREVVSWDEEDFTEEELAEAAKILIESGKKELWFYDEDRREDKEFRKLRKIQKSAEASLRREKRNYG